MQLVVVVLFSDAQAGFSTLYGSKWVATTSETCITIVPPMFQYPLRVEVGCNAFACATSNLLF